jgi:hypothetical protein
MMAHRHLRRWLMAYPPRYPFSLIEVVAFGCAILSMSVIIYIIVYVTELQ